MEIALKLADDMEEREMQQLDDLISGFWLEPPRVRATVYDAGEPLFVVADLDVWLLLDSGDWGPEVPVMEPVPATDPMTGQPALDLMGQPLMTMQPKGMAPEVLGPYWRNMWATDRNEAIKMLKDYAAILKERERKEEYAMAEMYAVQEMMADDAAT